MRIPYLFKFFYYLLIIIIFYYVVCDVIGYVDDVGDGSDDDCVMMLLW